ncbi:DNA-directed RNA polymerase I subunit RPA49 [Armadillidium nasatum]|uniref:DNA-directed RNA polymerase I subunit RPA49 n=1 Tax=Armadillidium nasatum TaxID=96803 RepID=A0A5N5TNF4_9CRUS|nr:DNA-directed RNA polymerase I subunit RPA49 [Armadillidium nasatum]
MDNSLNNLSSTSEKKKVPKRTFVIEDVIVKDYDKMEPCLVQFSNGVVKDTSKLEGKLLRNMSEKHIRRRSERILTVSNGNMTYTGKNFGDNIDPNIANRNFLGILDKNTNKMKLIEMSTFIMHPQLDIRPQAVDSFISSLKQGEKRSLLNETFGGRRERATVKNIEARQFDVHDMAGALHDMTQKIDTEDMEEEFEEAFSYDDILPPCDRDANLVENVYKLADIIPDMELVLYNDEAVEYMDNKKDTEGLSLLVRQTIANAKLSEDEEETAKLICIALYIQNLIRVITNEIQRNSCVKIVPKINPKKDFDKIYRRKKDDEVKNIRR